MKPKPPIVLWLAVFWKPDGSLHSTRTHLERNDIPGVVLMPKGGSGRLCEYRLVKRKGRKPRA